MGLLSGLCRVRLAASAVVTTNGLRKGRARDDKQWYHNPNPDAPERRPTVLVDSSGSSRLEDGDQHAPTIPAHQETERYQVREGYRIVGCGEAGHPAEGARAREFQSSFCPGWSPPSHHEERKEAAVPPRRPPLSKSSGAGAASWNDDGSSRKGERPRRRRSSSRPHESSRGHGDRSSSGSHRSSHSRKHKERSSSRSHRSARSHDGARRHKDRSSSRSHRSSRHYLPPPPPPENPTPEQQIAMLEAAAQSILDRVRGETGHSPGRHRSSGSQEGGSVRSRSKRRHPSGHSSRSKGRHRSKPHSKSKESASRSHSKSRSHSSKPRSKSHSQPRSRARRRPPHPDRIDYQGRCPGHPDVVLQRYSRKKGVWRTLLDECPLCGAEDGEDMGEGVGEGECATALSEELNQELTGKDSKVSREPAENDANKLKPKRTRSASQPRSTKAPPRRSRSNPRAHAKSHPGAVEDRPRRPSVEEIISHSQNWSRQSLNGSKNVEDEGAFYRDLARRLVCGKSSDGAKELPGDVKKAANDDDSDALLTRGTSNGTETTASLSTATSSLDPPSLPRRSSREFRHPKEVYFGGGGVCEEVEEVEEEQRDCRDECARSHGSGQESEEGAGEDAVGTVEGDVQTDAQDVDATFCLPCDAEAQQETEKDDATKIVRFADEANVLDYLASRVQESSIGQRLRGSFRS